MSLLYPWHLCSDSCYWWGAGQDGDYCNFSQGEPVAAHTGRPGCFSWQCAGCGEDWNSGDDHSDCQVFEVELE